MGGLVAGGWRAAAGERLTGERLLGWDPCKLFARLSQWAADEALGAEHGREREVVARGHLVVVTKVSVLPV